MRSQDQHLSTEELESLGSEEGLSGELEDQLQQAREHAESCAACKRRLQVYPTSGAKLDQLRAPQGAKKGPDCPSIDVWLHLAGGLLTSAEQQRYTNHAAQCDYCGPILREIAQDFAEPATEEEKIGLGGLQDGTKKLQRLFTAQLVPSKTETKTVRNPRAWFGFRGWKLATCVLLILGLVLLLVYRTMNSQRPENLLAEAYTQQRTLELRIPGARYAPLSVERGGGTARMNRPRALLEAEALISRQLGSEPNNIRLLQAKGRAELLEWNFDAAIQTFKKAQDIEPDNLSLKTDLASAYFERAEAISGIDVYGTASELLGQVLAKDPKNAIAIFNRAISLERMLLYKEAIADWEHYLKIDPSSEWAAEAKIHLTADHDKINRYEHQRARPLLTPAELVQNFALKTERALELDSRVEEYLDLATREWLPEAFRIRTQPKKQGLSSDAAMALDSLAAVLATRHSDYWLSDMLKSRPSVAWFLALQHLSNSISNNAVRNPDTAKNEAEKAVRLFHQTGSLPGLIRAQLEIVYSFHKGSQGKQCLEHAAAMSSESKGRSYAWIQAQLLLEEHVCFNITNDLKNAGAVLVTARRMTTESSFPSLRLRAIAFEASFNWSAKGNEPEAWSLYKEGLTLFWAGDYPELRAYQFYADLCLPVENRRYWQLASNCAAEAAGLASRMGDAYKALAYFRASRDALMAGKITESQAELGVAVSIFAKLPEGQAKETYQIDTEIRTASIEIQQGKLPTASDRLKGLEGRLSRLSNYFIVEDYFETLASLQCRQQDFHSAEENYRKAIMLAEAGLYKDTQHQLSGWRAKLASAYRGLVEVQLRQNHIEDALDTWESYRALPFRDAFVSFPNWQSHTETRDLILNPATSLSSHVSVSKVLPQLQRETIVSYVIFPNGLAIWVYDDRGVTGRWIAVSSVELEGFVRRFSEQCADPTSNIAALRRNGRRLYEWLIAPVQSHLDTTRTLVVEPDGVLGQIPWPALVGPTDHYLGSQHVIESSVGVAHYLRISRQLQPSTHSQAVIIASTLVPRDYAGMLYPLPDALNEARAVGQLFDHPLILDANNASLRFISQQLEKAQVLHFAGHAINTPEGVRLILARANGDVEFLDSRLFRQLPFNRLQLVVLSACATARLDEDGTLSTGTLVETLLETGVQRVIGSTWSVGSAPTVPFIQEFYEDIAAGKPLPIALHDAQVKSRSLNPHPYYWAPFQLWT